MAGRRGNLDFNLKYYQQAKIQFDQESFCTDLYCIDLLLQFIANC
jgi:hypothetical protein